jgi:two-component system, response regulator RegA
MNTDSLEIPEALESPVSAPYLLLVDDDETFRKVLAKAFTKRGYLVGQADSAESGILLAKEISPEYAVVDLKMPGESGLQLIANLIALDPNTRIVMLTGYASIATAIEAIKLGATHYLTKPANADEIESALHKTEGDPHVGPVEFPQSIDRMEWEHIQRVLNQHDGNISATARALKMHRRSLQRKLAKRPNQA